MRIPRGGRLLVLSRVESQYLKTKARQASLVAQGESTATVTREDVPEAITIGELLQTPDLSAKAMTIHLHTAGSLDGQVHVAIQTPPNPTTPDEPHPAAVFRPYLLTRTGKRRPSAQGEPTRVASLVTAVRNGPRARSYPQRMTTHQTRRRSSRASSVRPRSRAPGPGPRLPGAAGDRAGCRARPRTRARRTWTTRGTRPSESDSPRAWT